MDKHERHLALRVSLLPRDTNSQGTIFGGVILSEIDLAAAVEARRGGGPHRYVTVAMDRVVFHEPVFVGDLVSFYTSTVKVGRTSITVRVLVEAERWREPDKPPVKVTEAEVVFVAVDDHRNPVPIQGPDRGATI